MNLQECRYSKDMSNEVPNIIFTDKANKKIDEILHNKKNDFENRRKKSNKKAKSFSVNQDQVSAFQNLEQSKKIKEMEHIVIDSELLSNQTDSSINDEDILDNFQDLMNAERSGSQQEQLMEDIDIEKTLIKDSKIYSQSKMQSSNLKQSQLGGKKKYSDHDIDNQQNIPYQDEFFIEEQEDEDDVDDENQEESKQQQNEEDNKYDKYTVEKGDTMFGIALKFDINEQFLIKLNDTDNIFPGQKISVPKQLGNKCQEDDPYILQKKLSKQQSSEKRDKKQYKCYLGVDIWEQNKLQQSNCESYSYKVYFCTPHGSILGYLRISENSVMFDPDIEVFKKLSSKEVMPKYQLAIEMSDIHQCNLIEQPQYQKQQQLIIQEKIIQINLFNNGSKLLYEKYKKRLVELRKQGRPIITVFFRLADSFNGQKYLNKEHILSQIQNSINESAKKVNQSTYNLDKDLQIIDSMYPSRIYSPKKNKKENEEEKQINLKQSTITKVRTYEIIKENLYENQVAKSIWKGLGFEPKMIGDFQSNILNQKTFLQIIIKVPSVYRCTNWELIYGNIAHGTSFSTMIQQCRGEYPLFLVIQDFDDNLFGAYLSSSIARRSDIYGTGETFVFSFVNEDRRIKIYESTGKNDYFIHVDDGLTIGCSSSVAIYLDRNLLRGHSQKCDTFDNPILSPKTNFNVKNIEVWGLSL